MGKFAITHIDNPAKIKFYDIEWPTSAELKALKRDGVYDSAMYIAPRLGRQLASMSKAELSRNLVEQATFNGEIPSDDTLAALKTRGVEVVQIIFEKKPEHTLVEFHYDD